MVNHVLFDMTKIKIQHDSDRLHVVVEKKSDAITWIPMVIVATSIGPPSTNRNWLALKWF